MCTWWAHRWCGLRWVGFLAGGRLVRRTLVLLAIQVPMATAPARASHSSGSMLSSPVVAAVDAWAYAVACGAEEPEDGAHDDEDPADDVLCGEELGGLAGQQVIQEQQDDADYDHCGPPLLSMSLMLGVGGAAGMMRRCCAAACSCLRAICAAPTSALVTLAGVVPSPSARMFSSPVWAFTSTRTITVFASSRGLCG